MIIMNKLPKSKSSHHNKIYGKACIYSNLIGQEFIKESNW